MTRTAFVFATAALSAHALLAQSSAPRAAPATPAAAAAPAAPAFPASPDKQIAGAVLALPEPMRAGATVMGYSPEFRLIRLREGTNHMTCLADDPREAGFHAACYHDSLEQFMARGRELRASGVTNAEAVDSIRNADVTAGRIRMPPAASLYHWIGESWDTTTNAVVNGRALFVVYIPGATEASTGLSATPRPGMPWIMSAGTPRAHIMYSPGR